MPRRAAAHLRTIEPDPVHRSKAVQQVINKIMLDGKKSLAERVVYDALAIASEKTGKAPVDGATYQVPVEVPGRRARTLAVRWLVTNARARRERTIAQRLAGEMLDALSQQGAAYKRKEDIYRMAQANKAFAHYRW